MTNENDVKNARDAAAATRDRTNAQEEYNKFVAEAYAALKKNTEHIKEDIELLKNKLKYEKDSAEAVQLKLDLLSQQANLQSEIYETILSQNEEEIQSLNEQIQINNELLETAKLYVYEQEEAANHAKELLATSNNLTESERESLEIISTTYDQYLLVMDSVASINEDHEENVSLLEEQIAAQKELADEAERHSDAVSQGTEYFEDLGAKMLNFITLGNPGMSEINNLLLSTGASTEELKESLQNALAKFDPMKTGASLVNAAFNTMVDEMLMIVKAADEAAVNLQKMTTASTSLAPQIAAVMRESQDLGVTMATSGEAFGALSQNLSEFSRTGQADLKDMATQAAILNSAFGVDMANSAQVFQTITKTLGGTTAQAVDTTMQLTGVASMFNMSAQEVFDNFQNLAPELASLGDNMVGTFKALQAQARLTGVEINKIVDLAKKFQTFDSAAQQVGRLNAVLGGGFLNSVEMMELAFEKPEEILPRIIESFDQAGRSLDDMSAAEKRMFATAAGFDNVADFMNAVNTEMYGMDAAAQEAAMRQEELAEAAKVNKTFQEQLQIAFSQLAPQLEEIIPPLKEMVSGLLSLMQSIKPALPVIFGLTTFLNFGGIALLKFGASMLSSIPLMKMFGKTAEESVESAAEGAGDAIRETLGGVGDGLSRIGESATSAAKGLAVMAGFVLVFGLFMAVMVGTAVALKEFNVGFGEFSALLLAGSVAMIGMAAAIYIMIPALTGLAALAAVGFVPLAGLALVFLGIGASVFLAAAGVGLMAEGFAAMFQALNLESAASFALFAATLYTLAVSAPVTASGIAMMSLAFAAGLSATLLFSMAIDRVAQSIQNMTPGLESLAQLASLENLSVSFSLLRETFDSIVSSTASIDEAKASAVNNIFTNIKTVADSPSEQLQVVNDIIRNSTLYHEAKATTGGTEDTLEKIINKIVNVNVATPTGTPAPASQVQPQEVRMKVDISNDARKLLKLVREPR